MKKSKKIVYIVCPRYSGSTLLSFVIGFFNEISTIGERKKFYTKSIQPDLFENSCSCGETFSECPKWNDIKDSFFEKIKNEKIEYDFTQFRLNNFLIIHRILEKMLPYLISVNAPFKSLFRFILRKPLRLNKVLINTILELDKNVIYLDSSKPINHILYLSLISEFDIKVIELPT